MGRAPLFRQEPAGAAVDLPADNRRRKSVLGIVPEVPLEQGLVELREAGAGV
ncbi:MAG: hypothetical protein HYZ53_22870 [Planctomycetes bacterium]|nr:hypothetical protein [Planctomycetota bacterium]